MDAVKDYKLKHLSHPRLPMLAAHLRDIAGANPQLYDLYTQREKMEPKLRHTRSMYLASPRMEPHKVISRTSDTANILDCVRTRVYERFAPAIDEVVEIVRGELGVTQIGRIFITKLLPRSTIDPHIDQGEYFKFYHRVHLPLQTQPGCAFTVDDHNEELVEGDLYVLNNCLMHSVANPSEKDRVHLILDVA
ncbi:aspartyl/asparaginyl beta-hydroxylase domain-containing protein [Duganella sacchari]|nr:aspartyl/asparaginyl beta-hydroxylase domain-containing protein [Duganella sacchari]